MKRAARGLALCSRLDLHWSATPIRGPNWRNLHSNDDFLKSFLRTSNVSELDHFYQFKVYFYTFYYKVLLHVFP